MKYDEHEIAANYNVGRQLRAETMQMWLDAIGVVVPKNNVSKIVDLGCGTARFSQSLSNFFDANVIGIDPSTRMLAQTSGLLSNSRIAFKLGTAESIPIDDDSCDMIYLSMVYHHIENYPEAFKEFKRVLRGKGFLCIRNSTVDLLDKIKYLDYFPSAKAFNQKRLPVKTELISAIEVVGFELLSHKVLWQQFAKNLSEYSGKISKRVLSDLVLMSDKDFNDGLKRMTLDAKMSPASEVLEPIDLFIFRLE